MGIILERMRQKHRTMSYPNGPAPDLPENWRGWPTINNPTQPIPPEQTTICPTNALSTQNGNTLDVGRCIFCGACAGPVSFSRDYAMARFSRQDLLIGSENTLSTPADPDRLALIRSLFGKSLKLREISAGGCNACEADCNVLSTLAWDISRFGLAFVASPRHADGLLVTGPVTENMKLAVEKTYNAIPSPKVVIAVGSCAVSGGIYKKEEEGAGVLESMFPVDMYIPGCPPHPLVILEGLLRLMGRIPDLPEAEKNDSNKM